MLDCEELYWDEVEDDECGREIIPDGDGAEASELMILPICVKGNGSLL